MVKTNFDIYIGKLTPNKLAEMILSCQGCKHCPVSGSECAQNTESACFKMITRWFSRKNAQ